MRTIQWQVTVGQELMSRLDKLAEKRRVESRPMTQFEWLTKDKEGRNTFHKVTADPAFKNWSTQQMNDYLRNAYQKAMGLEIKSGRPGLNTHRLAVIEQALTLLEATEYGQG